ncbi:MAG: hypothetical protein ACLUAR_14045 [Pilosibacter sp.]
MTMRSKIRAVYHIAEFLIEILQLSEIILLHLPQRCPRLPGPSPEACPRSPAVIFMAFTGEVQMCSSYSDLVVCVVIIVRVCVIFRIMIVFIIRVVMIFRIVIMIIVISMDRLIMVVVIMGIVCRRAWLW